MGPLAQNVFERDDWSVEFHAFEITYRDPEHELKITTEFSEDGKLVYIGEALQRGLVSTDEISRIGERLRIALNSRHVAYEFVD